MIKRVICVLSVFCIMFGFAGCGEGVSDGLADYKTAAKVEIESYADSKGEDNYTAENWSAIEALVEAGKAAVDNAGSEADIDVAVDMAKEDIDEVEKNMKEFSLEISLDKQKVTVGDTVRITAVFKNLSGRDIPIELTDWQTDKNQQSDGNVALENLIIEFAVYPESQGYLWEHISIGVDPRDKKIITKDTILTIVSDYNITQLENLEIMAAVFFYLDEADGNFVQLYSDPIRIIVEE